jgi:polysaccharide biosynthesis/export protein
MNKARKSLLLFIIIVFSSSCVSKRELNYLLEHGPADERNSFENIRSVKEIEAYDKLYIKIYNLDPNVNALFKETSGARQDVSLISYSVNDSGYIDFPFVGKVRVEGLSIDEAKIKLEKEFNNYLPNTSVIVRFVGNVITVIGEVNRQGEFPFYDEKINIFQALSYAGGINNMGNKSEVVIIREVNNKITFYEMDLSKKSTVESPYYYLNPNDIIMVNPINAKYRTYRDFALIGMVSSTISTLILIVNFLSNQ